MDEEKVFLYKPLVLAYVGDSVFELYIRIRLAEERHSSAHALHIKAIRYVKAAGQAAILRAIEPELTAREKDVVRFGRNAHTNTMPRNADPAEYHLATGFEALLGYLKLSGQEERLNALLARSYECLNG